MLTRPIVVLRPLRPHHDDGSRTEPPVSVPIAHGAMPEATATPEPLLDPPGVRCASEIPRVPRRAEMLVGAPAAHREFDRVGLAEHDHALREKAARQGRGGRRAAVAPHHRAAGRDAALDVDQVFERDRHAVQRSDRMAGADRLVGGLGGEPRVVGIDVDKGVQLRIVRGDAGEQRLDDIDRRQAPRRDLGGQDDAQADSSDRCWAELI